MEINLKLQSDQIDLILVQAESRLRQGEMIFYGYRQTLNSIYKQLPVEISNKFHKSYPLLSELLTITSYGDNSKIDNETYLKQEIESLEEELKKTKNLLKLQREMYDSVFQYIDKAIYTEHCTTNHQNNTEFEKGYINGLIKANKTIDTSLRVIRSTQEEL